MWSNIFMSRYNLTGRFLLGTLLFFIGKQGIAENLYRPYATGNFSTFYDSADTATRAMGEVGSAKTTKLSDKKIRIKIRRIGWIEFSIDRLENMSWQATKTSNRTVSYEPLRFIFVRGNATTRRSGNLNLINGGIIKNDQQRKLKLLIQYKRNNLTRYFELTSDIGSNRNNAPRVTKIKYLSNNTFKNSSCNELVEQNQTSNIQSNSLANSKIITAKADFPNKKYTVATDADIAYFNNHGDMSNPNIALILDAVKEIYIRELGITLEITRQNVWTTTNNYPYGTSDATLLIQQFQTYSNENKHLGDADIYHLFTGNDFDGETIGIAYVAVTCSAPEFSYGISQDFNSAAMTSLVAHEIAHNFSATHDEADPQSIMATFINIPGSNYFSDYSKNELFSYINSSNGTACAEILPTPLPTVTIVATNTISPTLTPTVTVTPSPTFTPTATATIRVTPSVTPTGTRSPTPTFTATLVATATITPTPIASNTATQLPTATPSPTPTTITIATTTPSVIITTPPRPQSTVPIIITVGSAPTPAIADIQLIINNSVPAKKARILSKNIKKLNKSLSLPTAITIKNINAKNGSQFFQEESELNDVMVTGYSKLKRSIRVDITGNLLSKLLLNSLVITTGKIFDVEKNQIGESGSFNIASTTEDINIKNIFSKKYQNPLMVISIESKNSSSIPFYRLASINQEYADIVINPTKLSETLVINYIVIEQGIHLLPSGELIEAFKINELIGASTQSLSTLVKSKPLVLLENIATNTQISSEPGMTLQRNAIKFYSQNVNRNTIVIAVRDVVKLPRRLNVVNSNFTRVKKKKINELRKVIYKD
jgi:hypothetical protein